MKIDKLLFTLAEVWTQPDADHPIGKPEGRWFWQTRDPQGKVLHKSWHPLGFHNLADCQLNAETILGAEVHLRKRRGRYTHGEVIGRPIAVVVQR